ncbi:protein NATD1-like [Mizuhopecten yessoensis]|uniref:Protein NATD1 n=1 Tax=Mizuhopecten yessoensis TaxID=6573 RepID=A0A210Q398_MIZYE|nr:protein NATD1-like [Mizuhopecten yessoensis]OWF43221.1 Protein GTLF3B [Mizuhopecten yessoensis]
MSYRNLIKPLSTLWTRRTLIRCQPLTMNQPRADLMSTTGCPQSAGTADSVDKQESDSDMPFIVGHDKTKKFFYINLEQDGKRKKDTAILEYDWIRPGFVDLYHTGVPSAYRGQGIAKILAKAALEHFVAEDAKMRLSCSYLHKYVQETRLPRVWDNVVWDE